MKKIKLILIGLAVLATARSAFAVKSSLFGSGLIYCESAGSTVCHTANRVDFRLNPSGTVTTPCLTGTPHIITGFDASCNPICSPVAGTASCQKYSATAPGR